jgi:flagellar protein FliO/FliZ
MLKWLGGGARERPPRRVAVIDAAAVDRRRSVVLIRRDNVEHLMMIGGPTDVLIEPNIIRATGAREPAWPAAPGPTRLAGELYNRLTPPEVPPLPARSEAPRVAPSLMEPRGVRGRMRAPPEELAPPPQTVHNLEQLKRQLEAALRRSPAPQGRPPVTDPLAVPPPPTVSASEPPRPEAESKLEPKPEPKPEKPPEPEPQPKDEPAEPAGKKVSDIL